METSFHIGVDLGGTQLRAGLVKDFSLHRMLAVPTPANGTVEEVLSALCNVLDSLVQPGVASIGVGVPGLVELSTGTVYDLVYIPAWKSVPLQALLEERYGLPVSINNDANCFALGEWKAGKGRGCESMAGITLGTGMGTGLILHNKLHSGKHCGAGEFGMMEYRGQVLEYYASGQFFRNLYQVDGKTVFERANNGDAQALEMYAAFGHHLGNAIKMILYALDIDRFVLGGSVSRAWPWFRESMWQSVNSFAYRTSLQNLTIEVSELENSGIIGAASLYQDSNS